MTNSDRVRELIRLHPGVSDSDIVKRTGIAPHQQVNQICRKLAGSGLIRRATRDDGRIGNHPASGPGPPLIAGGVRPDSETRPDRPKPGGAPPGWWSVGPLDWEPTLLVLPCSARKRSGGRAQTGASLSDALPPALAHELAAALRSRLHDVVDEPRLLPALERYDGALYRELPRDFLRGLPERLVIISGGYGLVRSDEPITEYDARFSMGGWPRRLVPRCLAAYAEAVGARTLVALAAGTTGYAAAVRSADWRGPDVEQVWLLTPAVVGGAAMARAPAAIGQAAAHLAGTGSLSASWTARDETRLHLEQRS